MQIRLDKAWVHGYGRNTWMVLCELRGVKQVCEFGLAVAHPFIGVIEGSVGCVWGLEFGEFDAGGGNGVVCYGGEVDDADVGGGLCGCGEHDG